MIPPASTEPKYRDEPTEKCKLQSICSKGYAGKNAAGIIVCFTKECEFDTRARGPVQQAPDYCTHLKWLTQIEGDGDYRCELGNKTSCEWCETRGRCGDYKSQRDAALIAQEREKWERGKFGDCHYCDRCVETERAQAREEVLPYLDELISPSVSDARKREIVKTCLCLMATNTQN